MNKRRAVGIIPLAAACLAAFWAGAAAPVRADTNSVAIAIRASDGKASGSYGPQSLSDTETDALATCSAKHGPCVLAGSTIGACVGVAIGYAPYWESATGPTVALAETAAKAKIAAAAGESGGNPTLFALCSNGANDGWGRSV